jgi:hypothetical protein
LSFGVLVFKCGLGIVLGISTSYEDTWRGIHFIKEVSRD